MNPPICLFQIGLLALLPYLAVNISSSQVSRPDSIPKNEIALRLCVGSFWTAWQRNDFQRASQYVLPEQKELFARTRKFPVRKWEILAIKMLGNKQKAEVKIKIERYEPVMGGYFEWSQTALWIRRGSVWQMQIPEARLVSP
jgi:hypothetical protein